MNEVDLALLTHTVGGEVGGGGGEGPGVRGDRRKRRGAFQIPLCAFQDYIRRPLDMVLSRVCQVAVFGAGVAFHGRSAQELGTALPLSPSTTIQGVNHPAGDCSAKTHDHTADWETMESLEVQLKEKLNMWLMAIRWPHW